MQFDGVNDFAQVTTLGLGAPTEFTCMGWVVFTSFATSPYIFTTETGIATNGIRFWYIGSLRIDAFGGASVALTTGIIPSLNQRYHYAIRITGGTTLNLFIDGGVAGTLTVTTALPTSFTQLRLGANIGGTSNLQGRMSTWEVYERALSVAEIRAAARPKRGTLFLPNTQNLVAHYPLTAVSGATTQDVSGNGRNLTLVNMVANPIVAF
jgi:hypothetical protein